VLCASPRAPDFIAPSLLFEPPPPFEERPPIYALKGSEPQRAPLSFLEERAMRIFFEIWEEEKTPVG